MNKSVRLAIILLIALTILSLLLTIKLNLLESFRIVFGSFFVLFLPGYVMSFIFFKEIELIERIALSFALSIAVVPLAVFYLNLIGIKINLINSLITISSIIIISLVILYFKNNQMKNEQPKT